MSSLNDFISYLESQVTNNSIYVLGGQGENFRDITFRWLEKMEEKRRIGQICGLLANKYTDGKNMSKAKCFDCSGLFCYYALLDENRLIPYDMTADALYGYITSKHGKPIALASVKAGDFVFKGTDSHKDHVGYVVENGYVIESKGRSAGVVKSRFSEANWTHAARPDFWQYSINRELRLTDPMMSGDDVKNVQSYLSSNGYIVGDIDGIYGKLTESAVIDFQTRENVGVLKKNLGVVNKKTAKAMGFLWKC